MQTERPGTADDLLADARKPGYSVTRRLLTDWTSLGLLDSPTRRGAGRAKGTTKGLYSANQRQLFAVLLAKRANSTRVAHLTAIPVALWLYWGDDYVPLRQTKRALDTLINRYAHPGPGRSGLTTQALLAQLDHPDATDTNRIRLRRMLDQANHTGNIHDPEALAQALRAVFDPHNTGRTLGPPGARVGPESLVNVTVLRSRALAALEWHRVADAMFERSRQDLRDELAAYAAARPQLLTDADTTTRPLFAGPLLEQVIPSACHDLLLAIGRHIEPEEAS